MNINKEITPIVLESSKEVEIFKKEVMKTRNIISRFDEILLEKASKFSIEQLRNESQKSFALIKDLNVFKNRTKDTEIEMKKSLESMHQVLDNSHDLLFEKLSSSMDRYAKILNASYGKPVNASELNLHLA